jgi:dihydroorotase
MTIDKRFEAILRQARPILSASFSNAAAMQSTLIINATIVNEGEMYEGDVRIEGDRIERVGASLTARGGETIIDAAGRLLLPGLIDDQVHFREPGFPHKGDLASESGAAVAGGITSFFDMPNTEPQTLNSERLEEKYALARGRAYANYGFWHGASNDNLEAVKTIDPSSTPGLKIFMGASTGNMLVDNPQVLEELFKSCPTLICTHCEDQKTVEDNLAKAKAQFGESVPIQWHPRIRSHEACMRSTELAMSLARRHNARLHVLHISTAAEVQLFTPGPLLNKRITAETCVHFLHFDERHYDTLGNRIKCNPALKSVEDREGLIQAVLDDRIDILATDHAPHTLEEKSANYLRAPAGLPLVQYALPSLLERYFEGRFSLPLIVEKFCHAPAQLFGVAERGFIREGYFADLTMVNLSRPNVVTAAQVLSKVGWSPFEGYAFQSSVAATLVNGKVVWDGKALAEPNGRRLKFLSNRR